VGEAETRVGLQAPAGACYPSNSGEGRFVKLPVLLSLLVLSVACQSGKAPTRKSGTGEDIAAAAAPAPSHTAPPSPQPAPAHAQGPNDIHFPSTIEWHTWDEGLRLAKAQHKPMMVVVYADWCPKCRALAPVFAMKEVATLARKMIVVRQNHDDDPAWLQPFNQKYGGYVPRIFFFDDDGHVKEDVKSGHPRYPFFYAAQQPESLTRSMRQAIGS
jgi:thiol-disulfide isomerase/thioredoxin